MTQRAPLEIDPRSWEIGSDDLLAPFLNEHFKALIEECELDLTTYNIDGNTHVSADDFGVHVWALDQAILWRSLREMLGDEAEQAKSDYEDCIHGISKGQGDDLIARAERFRSLAKYLVELAESVDAARERLTEKKP